MGYVKISNGYRIHDPEKKRVFLSRDVIFDEWKFEGLQRKGVEECPFFYLNLDTDFEDGNVAGNRPVEQVNHETETPLRTSTRVTRLVERYGECLYNTNSIVTNSIFPEVEPTPLRSIREEGL